MLQRKICKPRRVTISVLNTAPVAVADAYTTDEDVPLVVDSPNGLLANDSDADGDQLSVHIVDGPLNGYINLSDNGGFEYIAYDPNFNGSDSFTYRAFDGIAYSELATVTLTINPVNDAPVADDDFYETWDEEELIVRVEEGMLSNDTDVDMDEGDVLTVTLVTTPTRGSVIYDPDGSFAYQPELSTEDYTATFTYNVVDSGGLTDTGMVTITVKAALPVLNDDFYESLEDTVLQGSVANNDRNVDGFAFTTTTLPEYGELIFAADGAFTYLPDEDFVGVDVFTYAVDDGTIEAPAAWVYITVHEDIVTAAIFNDEGFKSSTQLAAGDLDKAAVIAQDMNAAIMDAVSQTWIWADGNISVQDLFLLNDYLIDHYTEVDSAGHPIWVDGAGSVVPRQLNTGNDFYYVGQWADWHGDDAGGRLEYGYYGDAVEHGYHLIQNDGGTTTLDGTPGNYTLSSAGGDGQAFWPNVVDGLFHMGFDIVKGENGALEFADNYEEGVDYFFLLNEDGDRNESLADVANWLTYLLGQ